MPLSVTLTPISLHTHTHTHTHTHICLIWIFCFLVLHVKVCDLYCGGGVDIEKWDAAQITHYIGIGLFFFFLSYTD
jgi:mRNA (guanine-N7-)-methyltransferase